MARLEILPMIEKVANVYDLTVDDLLGKSRRQPIAEARQLAMYYIQYCDPLITGARIARVFSTSHSSVIYAYRQMMWRINEDPKLEAKFNQIKNRINENGSKNN